MEQEFTITTGGKIYYGFLACFLAAVAIIVWKVAYDQSAATPFAIVLFSLAVFMGGHLRKKVIISADRIIATNLIRTIELPTANVKGCRIGPKVISVIPDSPALSKIVINNYSNFGNSNDLVNWLRENFNDLDQADLETAREMVRHNTSLGATEKQREAKIKQARIIAIIYSIVGFAGGFICIPFIGNATTPVLPVILMQYPLIGILLMAGSKGLIKFVSNPRTSVNSFVYMGLFVPILILCFDAGMGRNIYQFRNAYIPIAVLGLVFFLWFYFFGINKTIRSIPGQVFLMVVTAFAYSFGTIIHINCLFDKMPPRIIHSTITDKFSEHHNGEHFYLRLTPFLPGDDTEKLEVVEKTYYRYNTGDEMDIDLKSGFLNIPWYYRRGGN